MKRLLALSFLLCNATSWAFADSTPAQSEKIQSLVVQLGSEEFSERETASKRLAEIGRAALPALARAAQSENPEVRDRASIILGKLQRAEESEALLKSKRLKLAYKNVSLGAAVSDFKTLTGLNVTLDPNRITNPLRLVTCETEELPVWEALEAFCVAAGLREVFAWELDVAKPEISRRGYAPAPATPKAEKVAIVLVEGKTEHLPGDRSTAVRVLVLPPYFPGHKVMLGKGELNLCLDVTPMPGLGWQEVRGVRISRLIDSEGRFGSSRVEKSRPAIHELVGMQMFGRPGMAFGNDPGNCGLLDSLENPRVVAVPLRLATLEAKSLKRLEGAVVAELQMPNQHLITIVDPRASTAPVTSGELRCSVLEVKEIGKTRRIRVQLDAPSLWARTMKQRGGWNGGFPEAPPGPDQQYRVEAFNADGGRFQAESISQSDQSADGMSMTETVDFVYPSSLGDPSKIVVVGPRPLTVQVPFSLANVPLP